MLGFGRFLPCYNFQRKASSFIYFHHPERWQNDIRKAVEKQVSVINDFISEKEESELLAEVEPHMKRLRYEKSHWDDAIHLYREREQQKWSQANQDVIQRVRAISFPPAARHLTSVHILDLHKDGVIKPHIDSTRYCGDVITGISLLSDCVMRLRHKEHTETMVLDLYLPRRSLYKLTEVGRFDFTHEILGNEESTFFDKKVPRDRRISLVLRSLPSPENEMKENESSMKRIPNE